MALAMQTVGLGAKVPDNSTHRLEWLPDGKVLIHLGASDLGQGLATISEQIVAESLGLPFSAVVTAHLDTSTAPDGGVTCASRMTYLVGNALLDCSKLLKKNLIEQAAKDLRLPSEELQYESGEVILSDGRHFKAGEFASRAAEAGNALQAEATASFPYPEETTPQHLPIGMPHVKFVFASHVVRVEVDADFGTVEVKDVVAIHDVGRVINRAAVEGQIEGGIVMGLGFALTEDFPIVGGIPQVRMGTLGLIRAPDAPPIDVRLVQAPGEKLPYAFGAKGVGELCLIPTAPACSHAYYRLDGQFRTSLPLQGTYYKKARP